MVHRNVPMKRDSRLILVIGHYDWEWDQPKIGLASEETLQVVRNVEMCLRGNILGLLSL